MRRPCAKRRRPVRAAATLLLAAWTVGCTVKTRIPPGEVLAPRAQVEITAEPPVALTRPGGALDALPVCHVARLAGEVDRQVGDTLIFARVYRTAAAPSAVRDASSGGERSSGATTPCGKNLANVTLLRSSALVLTERRVSTSRSLLLVAGVALVALALAAYAASTMELDGGWSTAY